MLHDARVPVRNSVRVWGFAVPSEIAAVPSTPRRGYEAAAISPASQLPVPLLLLQLLVPPTGVCASV